MSDMQSPGGLTLSSPIGLVAGNGALPEAVLAAAARRGLAVVTVAHRGETSAHVAEGSAHCVWVGVGQLGKIISTFEKHRVRSVTFAGGIRRVGLFGPGARLKLDARGLRLITRLRSLKDDVLLRGIAEEFERSGIAVFGCHELLPEILAPLGQLTSRSLSPADSASARVGWEAAEAIGRADIGQTVIVKDSTVVAVEAIEGTNEAIRRAGALAGPGCVVVKRAKPHQDLRLDLPTVGMETIAVLAEIRAAGLVLEAGRTQVVTPEAFRRAADAAAVAVVGWDAGSAAAV